MKSFLIIAGLVILGALIWFFVIDNDEEPVPVEQQDFPVRLDESTSTAEPASFQSENGNLSFQYPDTWNVTPAAGNDDASQLFTVESPLDANEFYFCLDLNRVSAGNDVNFATTDAELTDIEVLENERVSVLFRIDGVDGMLWSVTDDAPELSDSEFDNELGNQAGDRLQILGRFNCRDEQKPDISVDEFKASRWFNEAKTLINSLDF